MSQQAIQTRSVIAAAELAPYIALKIDSNAKVDVCDDATGTEIFIGFNGSGTVTAGERAPVTINGQTKGVAGTTLTAGTHSLLMVTTAGKLIPWTEGNVAVAMWLPVEDDTAAASGDVIDILALGNIANATGLGDIVSGSATIALGTAAIAVTLGAAFNGKPVTATLAGADATALYVQHASIAAGDLTITANANATADVDVYYIVDGR